MQQPTVIFFDGACHLCSREVAHYTRQDKKGVLKPVDISLPEFDAAAHGLDAKEVHRHMHVRRPDGSLAVGVDAFVSIWEALGRYALAVRLARNPVVRPGLNAAYRAFARIRPYLPKRKSPSCDAHCGTAAK